MPTPNTSACAESTTMNLATPGIDGAGQRHWGRSNARPIASRLLSTTSIPVILKFYL
jgi:hypothetical protein